MGTTWDGIDGHNSMWMLLLLLLLWLDQNFNIALSGNGGPRYGQWRGGTGVCYFWDPMLKITWKNTWELFGLGPNTIIKRRPPSIFLFQRGKNVVWKIINIYKQRRTRWFFNFWPQRFQLLFWAQKECVREHDARGRDCVDCPL